ncbi:uncharacterized protein [Nicotiana tomentosiformis]|uniref:uncharacterized protein n=1 Tax=Nicotiana tomentosiformis TaxID=4098 RepID=UPI00388C7495
MAEKGSLAYLAFVRDNPVETPMTDSMTMVWEFSDVFHVDFPGKPLDRDINIGTCIQPISILPYHMAPAKLKELKMQLQELLKEGIHQAECVALGCTSIIREEEGCEYVDHGRERATFEDSALDFGGIKVIRFVLQVRVLVRLCGFLGAYCVRLTQKGAKFRWSDDCEASFQKLKTALTITPVRGKLLHMFHISRIPMRRITLVHNLELAAIVHAVKIWKHYLYRVSCEVYTDHRSLQHLFKQRETILRGDAKEVNIRDDGVLRLQGHLCVPNVDGFKELILEEAHNSRYSIHPGATKMYPDLRQHYWWPRIKKDIVEYVARSGFAQHNPGRRVTQIRKCGFVIYGGREGTFEGLVDKGYHEVQKEMQVESELDESLGYEEDPVVIVDRQVRKLRSKEIAAVKVQ